MSTRTTDHLRTVFDQAVEFGSERRDLRRKTAFEPSRLTFADTGKGAAHAVQRLQSYANLDKDRCDQTHAKYRKRPEQNAIELRDFVFNLGYVCGNEQRKGSRRTFGRCRRNREFNAPRHETQSLPVWPLPMTPDEVA